MALKAGYYGLKRSLLNKVKALPGIKSIGTGLSLNSTTGELEATGATISIEANPEGAATENLIKLGLGENVYAVPDAAKTYQTDDVTESTIVDADYIPFFDSSAASGSGAPKKSTWTNFIAKIKAKITEFVTWGANSILGAKNLLPNDCVTATKNGITATVNSDGTVTVNGTSTAEAIFNIHLYSKDIKLSGDFILNGCPIGGTNETYQIYLQRRNAENTGWDDPIYRDFGDGVNVTIEDERLFDVNILIRNGTTLNNLVFKPMLRLAADSDDTYVPYAMTNRELTGSLNDTGWKNATVNSDNVASGTVRYREKSGFCYVIMENIVMKAAGNNQSVATGLPVQDGTIACVDAIAGNNENAPIGNAFYMVNNSSVISGHIKSTNGCYASFSYIVKKP